MVLEEARAPSLLLEQSQRDGEVEKQYVKLELTKWESAVWWWWMDEVERMEQYLWEVKEWCFHGAEEACDLGTLGMVEIRQGGYDEGVLRCF